MSTIKSILRSTLDQMLKLLDEDQLMHFRKIHRPIDELNKKGLLKAIDLVERSLKSKGIELLNMPPTIKRREDVEGVM